MLYSLSIRALSWTFFNFLREKDKKMNEAGVLLLNLLHYCKRKVKEKVCVSTKQN